jgi:hypothetical protein
MNLFKRSRGLWVAGLMAVAVSASLPSVAHAKPVPGVQRGRGFRVFARTLGAIVVNRVYLGLNAARGEIGVDSANSSTIGGGYWPKGTPNQYVFNSGLQVAGITTSDAPGFAWNNDKTGAFFFDARGNLAHGSQIEPVWNSRDPNDVANWPDAARVPNELTPEQQLFNPLLRGRVNASQGDVWFLNWDGDPTLSSGRPHPLGVMVENRGLGWNYPSGNQDIVYFTFTFYNVTASDPAAYANIRPEIRPYAIQAGADFQRRNEASYAIDIPDAGYTLDSLFAAFAADMDVANAGSNFCSVNLPFALGYCYEHTFTQEPGWQFDPGIFGPPFFAGTGFVGVKYLRSPTGPGEINLFSNTINSGTAFRDPQDVFALYRYLSGNIDQAVDGNCNNGDPKVTKVCFINPTNADARFYQSSTPLTLAPGEFGSIVVAYIFAAPVALPGFAPTASTDVRPGNPLRLTSPTLLASGANQVDSLTGFSGFTSNPLLDPNKAEQSEFKTVTGSLLGKSLTAQAVFDNRFLLPFSPESPSFFLVPGNNQVTVVWQKSASETTGDPFFEIANNPGIPGEPNPLYDPNYRQFDVEGYRVYRGRVDNSEALSLVAQFDYSGTTFEDYTGQVNPLETCDIVLGVTDDCAADYDYPIPANGTAATVSNSIPLVGQIIQTTLQGQRAELANGTVINLVADTLLTGAASGKYPPLEDTGVPFTFVDRDVKNNFRYFYSVTAFDVNSIQSGPSTLESPRTTKPVTPVAASPNYQNSVATSVDIVGRNGQPVASYAVPTLDPTTGIFSGPMPPSDGVDAGLVSVVAQVLQGQVRVAFKLDSFDLGQAEGDGGDAPVTYYWTAASGEDQTKLTLSVPQSAFDDDQSAEAVFPAVSVDAELAALYGGNGSYTLNGQIVQTTPGAYYLTAKGRGCINGAAGFDTEDGCDYNGSRWFSGANESFADPNQGNEVNSGAPAAVTNFINAGKPDGVTAALISMSYQTAQNSYRRVEYRLAGAMSAADFKVYWGAPGVVDSVIDVVHNVPVPFRPGVKGRSWGILTSAGTPGNAYDNRPNVLTSTDISCVAGMRTAARVQSLIPCAAATPTYAFTQTATLGDIALWSTTSANARSLTLSPTRANAGFMFYLAGDITMFQVTALPTNTVWTLRQYAGAIAGGPLRSYGPYKFTPVVRPFNAEGASVVATYDVTNQTVAVTNTDLAKVHTVPDPYYVTNQYEQTTENKILKFVNLPNQCIIRIYSASGILVQVIEHNSSTNSGEETWNLRNRNNQVVASGVYFYHLESGDARRVGRFTVVNFAQ